MIAAIKQLLAHPLTRGLALDDPRTTALRRDIIRSKGFLRSIYEEWYRRIADALPAIDGRILEIGSGGGFLRDLIPDVICSEVFATPGINLVCDAQRLPFSDGSLRAIVMVDVLHHVPSPARFLVDAARAMRPGGAILMIEPWRTAWSEWIYQRMHHEPFDPAGGWELASSGPLSGSNQALPWILFARDRAALERRYPEWRVAEVAPMMPTVYLASGGVSMRSLLPGFAYRAWRGLERSLGNLEQKAAMFSFIRLERVGTQSS